MPVLVYKYRALEVCGRSLRRIIVPLEVCSRILHTSETYGGPLPVPRRRMEVLYLFNAVLWLFQDLLVLNAALEH